jgi:hypothetical protein
MDILSLLRDRHVGRVRITFAKNYNEGLRSIVATVGLPEGSSELRKIAQEEAIDTMTSILWRDLAYTTELIKKEEAHQRAQEFINEYASTGASFYNNLQSAADSGPWSPVSDSTFDRCMLIVNTDSAVCVLAEDED